MSLEFYRLRHEALAVFRAAIDAVEPGRLVAQFLSREGEQAVVAATPTHTRRWRGSTTIIGAGKAVASMAAACERLLGADAVTGEVIVPDGCGLPLVSIAVSEAGHPLPDKRGEAATRRSIRRLRKTQTGGVLCLISGGASSLMVCPRDGVTLADKVCTTERLLASGAGIDEFNCVRKHLSAVKGGALLRCAQVPITTLLLSDVVGDAPSTIGSGPTAADPTTFADALGVLARHGLTTALPVRVIQHLHAGQQGLIPETVKPGSPEAARSHNVIVGSNRTALSGAADAARRRGWNVHVDWQPLIGDTTDAATAFIAGLREMAQRHVGVDRLCVLRGGETTVTLAVHGRGGRNQEFALAAARAISGWHVVLLSAGTDGVDGPTDAAGAIVDGSTCERATRRGLDPEAALAAHDSYTFFGLLDDLVRCGPTGTNVGDIKIALLTRLSSAVSGPVLEASA